MPFFVRTPLNETTFHPHECGKKKMNPNFLTHDKLLGRAAHALGFQDESLARSKVILGAGYKFVITQAAFRIRTAGLLFPVS